MKAEDRPQSIAAFRELLKQTGRPASDEATRVMTRPESSPALAENTRRRTPPADSTAGSAATVQGSNRTALMLGAALIMILAVAGGLFWMLSANKTAAPDVAGQPSSSTETAPKDQPKAMPEIQPAALASPGVATQPGPLAVAETPAIPEANETPLDTTAPQADPEDEILTTWDLNAAIREARKTHITGTLLAYIRSRQQFDSCLEQGCPDIATLKKRLDGSRQSPWQRDNVQGEIIINTGAKTSVIGCTWRLEVEENIATDTGKRRQKRIYCTNNGLDRLVESHEPTMEL